MACPLKMFLVVINVGEMPLTPSGYRLGMLLNILQCAQQAPMTMNYLARKLNSVEVEKHFSIPNNMWKASQAALGRLCGTPGN